MDLGLAGKRAIVTGSTGGIGEGIAKTLAREGVAVVVQGRNESAAQRVRHEIEATGGKAILAIGDLATDEGAKRVVDKALAEFGAIEILVNNAGAYEVHGWTDATPRQWLDTFNQNVLSMVRMIRLVAPQMRQVGWGRIIQVSSVAGIQPLAALPDYNVTKAAVINMTVSLAKELANTGVTVNTVAPGPIMTSGWIEWARGIKSSPASSRRSCPIRWAGSDGSRMSPTPRRSWPARSRASSTAPICGSTAVAPRVSTKNWPAVTGCRGSSPGQGALEEQIPHGRGAERSCHVWSESHVTAGTV